ncbi:hypothetical protein HIM_05090 [Hirsutella minnesotensis 3608]|uniref:Peroxidase n=1 Tax=Hirsutella minnesotensis 3608 TaxID=1043627 RepID=A0A0F8A0U5_9HYPO|nr:hypothetical protein HIM_05090 [Hirsutella minnesotensis 3608]
MKTAALIVFAGRLASAFPGMRELKSRAAGLESRGTNEMIGDLLTLPDDKLTPTGAQIKALLSGKDQPEGSLDVYLGVPAKDTPECKADTCCIWKHIADDMSSKMKDSIAGCNSLARQCVRLGFHDAGSFSKNAGSTGGATGHTVLARECYDRPINRGLPSVCDQMTAWHEQYKQYGVSMADLIQFAANVATVTCPLGPRVRSFVGRKDNPAPGPENTLPQPTQNADELINLFADKTISPDELVALVGAHTTATQHFFDQRRAGSPLDTTPGVWDVRFYGQVRQPIGPAMITKFPSDVALSQDSRTRGTWDGFTGVITSQLPWNLAYARAYIRLSMLGVNNINELQECTKALPSRLDSFLPTDKLDFELLSKNDPPRENMTASG